MKLIHKQFYLLGFVLFCWLPAGHAGIKCWTNDAGVRECGSVIPPKYVKQGHQVLDERGSVVKEIDAEISQEEREKLKQQEADRRRAEEEAKRQAEEDRRLIDTYPTESDIVLARDSKLASIAASMKIAKRQIDSSAEVLVDVEKELERNKNKQKVEKAPRKEEVDARVKELEEYVANLRGKIERAEVIIKDKQAEQESIHEKFEHYLERYRELKQRQVKEKLREKQQQQQQNPKAEK